MKSARLGSLLVALLVLTTAIAGCHGLDEGDDTPGSPSTSPDPTGNTTGSPTPSATPTDTPLPDDGPDVTLTLVDAPDNVTRGTTLNLTVEVAGDDVDATLAEIGYSYNSTEPIARENLTVDDFNETVDGNDNLTFPGSFEIVDWTIDMDWDRVFVRAHIVVDGQDFWSDEVVMAIHDAPDDGDDGGGSEPSQIHRIYIDRCLVSENATCARVSAAPCDTAEFRGNGGINNPTVMSITQGEGVVWVNADANPSCVHTATSTGGPVSFDTGELANGETSATFVFNIPGDYAYECTLHPSMTGTVRVAPA